MQDILSNLPKFLPEGLPSKGSLTKTPAYHVLFHTAHSMFSGRIVFERANRVKHVFLDRGQIVGIHSNLVPEGADMLLSQGFLFSSQIAEIFTHIDVPSSTHSDWEAQFLATLKEKRVLSEEEIEKLLLLQVEERILNLMGWFDGKYLLYKGDTPPGSLELSRPHSLLLIFEEMETLFGEGKSALHSASPQCIDRQGDLHSTGGARVLFGYSNAHASGTIFFERGQRKKLVHFESGSISSVVSTNPSETLGSVLIRYQFLSEDIVSRLESTAHARQTPLQDLLKQEHILSSQDVDFALRVLHVERILETFSWRSGRFEFKGTADHILESQPDETTERFSTPPQSATERTCALLDQIIKDTQSPILVLSPLFSWTPRLPNLLCNVVNVWNHAKEQSILISPQPLAQEKSTVMEPTDPRWSMHDFWHGLLEEYARILIFAPTIDRFTLPPGTPASAIAFVGQNRSTPHDIDSALSLITKNKRVPFKGFVWLTKEFLHLE